MDKLSKESAIKKYDLLSRKLLKFEFWTLGLGITLSSCFGLIGAVNSLRNPYEQLPLVAKYLETERGLNNIRENKFTLKQIVDSNPELLNPQSIEAYVNKQKEELSSLEVGSGYISYKNWNERFVSYYFKSAGIGMGMTLGLAALVCTGISLSEKKKRTLEEK